MEPVQKLHVLMIDHAGVRSGFRQLLFYIFGGRCRECGLRPGLPAAVWRINPGVYLPHRLNLERNRLASGSLKVRCKHLQYLVGDKIEIEAGFVKLLECG